MGNFYTDVISKDPRFKSTDRIADPNLLAQVRGPGYPFPSALSEQDFIREPLQTFHSKNPCLEITEP